MSDSPCKSIDERLVAYSDGQLSAEDAGRVEAHLAQCPDCREELRALEHSLEIARSVWNESAESASVPRMRLTRPIRRLFPAAASAVACLLLLAITVGHLLSSRGDPDVADVADTPAPEPIEKTIPQSQDIRAVIARQERAARLLVSARLLATQPGLEEYSEQAERYLAETYGVSILDGLDGNHNADSAAEM